MYQEIGGHLIWVADHTPHWNEWRGKLVYRQRPKAMQHVASRN